MKNKKVKQMMVDIERHHSKSLIGVRIFWFEGVFIHSKEKSVWPNTPAVILHQTSETR